MVKLDVIQEVEQTENKTVAELRLTAMQDIFNPSNFEIKQKTEPGLNEEVIRRISEFNQEPEWMLQHRLKCFEIFKEKAIPNWGPDLSKLDFDKIVYFSVPNSDPSNNWEKIPKEIREVYEKLGIPKAEQEALAGVGAQMESQNVYHRLKEQWENQGVIFEDFSIALKKYPDLIKKYFMKCVSPSLHKFAALHGAVFSGGTFLFIPKGVQVTQPLQAYFRMNERSAGQFEHTLIIIEDESEGHYIEGCSSPIYNESGLHAGCVEIFLGKNSRFRYSSVENWSKNTYNLNTKRAIVDENSVMEWVSGNAGSYVTMLYPSTVLKGKGARADHLSIVYAGKNQNQDVGSKVFHMAANTSSKIISKSISKDGGITTYRGMVKVKKGAKNCKSIVECSALMVDNQSTSNTVPYTEIDEKDVDIAHEATVGKISSESIFYLTSRGLSEEQAKQMIVSGFIEPITKELPLEYAVELNKLIELEMDNDLS